METLKFKNKTIYTINENENGITPIGEVSGEFKVISSFERFGYSLTLISDIDGVFLILA